MNVVDLAGLWEHLLVQSNAVKWSGVLSVKLVGAFTRVVSVLRLLVYRWKLVDLSNLDARTEFVQSCHRWDSLLPGPILCVLDVCISILHRLRVGSFELFLLFPHISFDSWWCFKWLSLFFCLRVKINPIDLSIRVTEKLGALNLESRASLLYESVPNQYRVCVDFALMPMVFNRSIVLLPSPVFLLFSILPRWCVWTPIKSGWVPFHVLQDALRYIDDSPRFKLLLYLILEVLWIGAIVDSVALPRVLQSSRPLLCYSFIKEHFVALVPWALLVHRLLNETLPVLNHLSHWQWVSGLDWVVLVWIF